MQDSEFKRRGRRGKYPLELKEKALLELAESGSAELVACHYSISKQVLYSWKSGLKRK